MMAGRRDSEQHDELFNFNQSPQSPLIEPANFLGLASTLTPTLGANQPLTQQATTMFQIKKSTRIGAWVYLAFQWNRF